MARKNSPPDPPFQHRVVDFLNRHPGTTWSISELAEQLNLSERTVGGACYHLAKAGKVRQPEKGVGKFTSLFDATDSGLPAGVSPITDTGKVEPLAVPNGKPTRYQTGSLFEVLGYTRAGTLVLREVDTNVVVPVKLHERVS